MLYNISEVLRSIIVLPMIIFIPGYLLVSVLFPTKKTDKGIDDIQRVALSLGLSLVLVPLLGLGLYYIVGGLTLQTILFGLGVFIFIVGILAIYRWYRTPPDIRHTIQISISLPTNETKLDKILTIALIICIATTLILVTYVAITPKPGEHFTEFYILGSQHLASNYPMNLTTGENTTIILGVVNHEKTTMNYSIEVWLSNQTTQLNTSTNMNETIYHNLWFMDKINTTLPSTPINLEELSTSQWEYKYTFNITWKGNYKMMFLLYVTPTQMYSKNDDYMMIALQKVEEDTTTAYRTVYLWINVK
jgi:uncharacterized membrane protein